MSCGLKLSYMTHVLAVLFQSHNSETDTAWVSRFRYRCCPSYCQALGA